MFALNKTVLALVLTVAMSGFNTCSQPANTESKPAKAEKATESKADASSTERVDVQEITINNSAKPESLDQLIKYIYMDIIKILTVYPY